MCRIVPVPELLSILAVVDTRIYAKKLYHLITFINLYFYYLIM